MILTVGLTGGIASGKSTVAATMRSCGFEVVDADEVVARLYAPGGEGHERLVARYGDVIVDASGAIDRKRLSEIALATPETTSELNELIHPLVLEQERHWMEELARDPLDRVAVVEATLLLESGGKERYDRIVVVDVEPEEQLRRGTARGLPAGEVARRIARQLSRDERVAAADYVISSEGSVAETARRTRSVCEALLADLERKKSGA
jgi:dephospho-CoA kinase